MSVLTQPIHKLNFPDSIDSREAVPYQLMPSSATQSAIPITKQIIQLAPSNGNSSQANGILQFNLPNYGMVKAGSVSLAFTLTLTGAGAATTWNFGDGRSASSVINRLTVNSGGNILESINSYNQVAKLAENYCCSAGFTENVLNIISGYNTAINTFPITTATTYSNVTSVPFVVPVISGILSSPTNRSFPLYLTSNGLQLQFDINTLAQSIQWTDNVVPTNTPPTGFSLTNISLTYELQQPSEDYQNGIRAMLMEGKLYEFDADSFYCIQSAGNTASSINFSVGLGLSSVNAVFQTEVEVTNATVTSAKQNSANQNNTLGGTLFNFPATVSRRVYLDGIQPLQQPVTTGPITLTELRKCISELYDADVNSQIGSVTRFEQTNYFSGFNCRRFTDSDLVMTGTKCNVLQVQVDKGGITGVPAVVASLVYVLIAYSAMILIDATGQCSVAK